MSFKIIFLLMALLLDACSYKHGKPDGDASSGTLQPSADLLSSISFAQVYQKVFSNKCIECHGDSTSYAGVNVAHPDTAKAALAGIQQSALIERSMPKNGSLTNDEYVILSAWVQAGGPNLAGENSIAPSPAPLPTLAPSFISISKNILEKKCVACHNPSGEASFLPLQTQAELAGSFAVVPGNAAASEIYSVIKSDSPNRMPPISSGKDALSSDEVEAIKEWINNGAKD